MSDVTLRPVEQADIPHFFAHQLDEEALRMAAFPARDEQAFRAHWDRLLADDTLATRTILEDGAVAGNIGAWPAEGRTFVGYWLGREHWGRGVASAALALFAGELPQRPLHAFVAAHNLGSIRVLEKCGFRRIGAETGEDGVDEYLYELPA